MAATMSPMPSWRWTQDGKFLALRVHTTANLGAYLSTFAPLRADLSLRDRCCRAHTRPRRSIARSTAVFTNTAPVDAYRGAGRPEATYVIERIVELAARELKLDPAEIRRRNFIQPNAVPVPDAGDHDL